jgi:uncharacterized membrane protein required for colicin V production
MTWFDVVAVLLVIGIAFLESQRGFGRALFDLVGGIISLKLATFLAGPLGKAAPVLATGERSEALWLAVTFLVLAAATVVASKFLYETTLLSLDVLDPVVGGLLGIASGMVVAHIFLRMLLVSYGEAEVAEVLLDSFVGQELLKFRTYHRLIETLENLGRW